MDTWPIAATAPIAERAFASGTGRYLLGWLLARRYPLDQPRQAGQRRAVERLKQWGSPLLLLSWLPLVGDPLCFAAGWLRMNAGLSALFMGAGKAARYAVILLALPGLS